VTVEGERFTCPGVLLSLGAYSLGDEIAPIGGKFTATPLIEPDVPLGNHELEASCTDNSSHRSVDVEVVAPRGSHQQRIVVSPRAVRAGESVAVDGTGFDDCIYLPGATVAAPSPVPVVITFDGSQIATELLAEAAPTRGAFHTTFTVPAGAAPADHMVVATCHNRYLPGTTSATGGITVSRPQSGGNGGGGGTGGGTSGGTGSDGSTGQTGSGSSGSSSGGSSGGGNSGGSNPGGTSPGGTGSGIELTSSAGPLVVGGGLGLLIAVVVATIATRGRPRPIPPRTRRGRQRGPAVTARSGGTRPGLARLGRGSGQQTAIRVVVRPGGGAR
jgi:hypothetical protein